MVSWVGCKNVKEYIIEYSTVDEMHEEVRESLTINVTKETELDTFAKLTNLRPMSNYNCRVIAVGHSGSRESSDYVRFETIGIPPEKPTRIAFQILAPTSLQVNWGEPWRIHEYHKDGIHIG